MSKYKKIIWIALAILFLVVIFFAKNKNLFVSTEKYIGISQQNGLTYDPNETVADLINKSTTGDGIPDWEKILYGLDPTKTENIPGVPDSATIAKLQAQQAAEGGGQTSTGSQDNDNGTLTQTDQFAREFFATITSLDENGAIDANGNMDQATQDQITNSLINNIQNSPQRKIYTLADLKITADESTASIKKYSSALNELQPKTPLKYTIPDVLNQFVPDDTGNNINPSALSELDPIINQTNSIMTGMLKMEVPQSFSLMHLALINAMEGTLENLSDLKLYDADPVVAFSAMVKYQTNTNTLISAAQNLNTAINSKLKISQ